MCDARWSTYEGEVYLCISSCPRDAFFRVGPVWPANLVDDTREAIRLGKYDRALKLLDGALDKNPTDVNAHLLMTEYYLALQDYGSAELSTERTLVLNRTYAPLIAQAYYNAAERAEMRKQPAQALALYETAVALDPVFQSRVRGSTWQSALFAGPAKIRDCFERIRSGGGSIPWQEERRR